MQETKIKICGLYRCADIEYVNRAMPDYAGFIFYSRSYRYVSTYFAAELIGRLNKNIKAVGVFVNTKPEKIAKIAENAGLDIIQLHGDETNAEIDEVRRLCGGISEVWKAVRIKDSFSADMLKNISHADKFLADTYVEGYGGRGKKFDIRLIKSISREKLIVAGGINISNIKSVIDTLGPYAVDISSGVETNGVKDRDKILDLVNLVRQR